MSLITALALASAQPAPDNSSMGLSLHDVQSVARGGDEDKC